MNKILLFTGVAVGIVAAFITYQQMLLSSYSEDSGTATQAKRIGYWPNGTVSIKELVPEKTKTSITGVESRGNETQKYFVIVKDTAEVFKGWRPKKK